MFDQKGAISFDKSVDYEKLFEAAINLDADDIIEEDEEFDRIAALFQDSDGEYDIEIEEE